MFAIIRTITDSTYSTILRTYQLNEKQKAKAELKLLKKGDIIYDYELKEYQEVKNKKSGGNILKKEIDITGRIRKKANGGFEILLLSNNFVLDLFALDNEENKVDIELRDSVKSMLGIEDSYRGYIKLISELGLKIPKKYQEHWTPKKWGEKEPTNYFYWVNSTGWVEREEFSGDTFENRLIANFNAFPTRELAELGCNVSKISRLALLWQYANDCVHTPDWSSNTKNNFYFSLNIKNDKIDVDRAYFFKRDCIYFKGRKQAEAFVEMYDKELRRLMSQK